MAALPEQPRDVVGDVRVCRYLRFYSGDVAKVSWGGRGKNQETHGIAGFRWTLHLDSTK